MVDDVDQDRSYGTRDELRVVSKLWWEQYGNGAAAMLNNLFVRNSLGIWLVAKTNRLRESVRSVCESRKLS